MDPTMKNFSEALKSDCNGSTTSSSEDSKAKQDNIHKRKRLIKTKWLKKKRRRNKEKDDSLTSEENNQIKTKTMRPAKFKERRLKNVTNGTGEQREVFSERSIYNDVRKAIKDVLTTIEQEEAKENPPLRRVNMDEKFRRWRRRIRWQRRRMLKVQVV